MASFYARAGQACRGVEGVRMHRTSGRKPNSSLGHEQGRSRTASSLRHGPMPPLERNHHLGQGECALSCPRERSCVPQKSWMLVGRARVQLHQHLSSKIRKLQDRREELPVNIVPRPIRHGPHGRQVVLNEMLKLQVHGRWPTFAAHHKTGCLHIGQLSAHCLAAIIQTGLERLHQSSACSRKHPYSKRPIKTRTTRPGLALAVTSFHPDRPRARTPRAPARASRRLAHLRPSTYIRFLFPSFARRLRRRCRKSRAVMRSLIAGRSAFGHALVLALRSRCSAAAIFIS